MVHRIAEAIAVSSAAKCHDCFSIYCFIDIPPHNGACLFWQEQGGYFVAELAGYLIDYSRNLSFRDGEIILTHGDGSRSVLLPKPESIDTHAHIRNRKAAESTDTAIHRGI
jgi:hypothetical protein